MRLDFSPATDKIEEITSHAAAAESLGFDTLWVPETKHDPFIALATVAQRTSRIRLATGIALAFPRNPMSLAYTCWDLQQLSQGRFILGLGTQVKGHIERRFGMPWPRPIPTMRETIQALRHIWSTWQTGQPLNFKSQLRNLTLMTPFFNPGRITNPNIPIFVAAVNKGMCQLAGEVADGILVHSFHTHKYLKEVIRPNLEKGIKKAGRTPEEVRVVAGLFTATGRDRASIQAAKEVIRAQVAFYASTRTYKPVLDIHGWGDISAKLHARSVKGEWKAMPQEIPDEVLEEFMVEGSYEEIPQLLEEKYGQLVDRVVLSIPLRQLDTEWRSITQKFI